MLYTITDAIDAVNAGEDIPEVLDDPTTGDEAFDVSYHRTDAWRGYYDAKAREESGWVHADEGWMTGDYDDAPAEARGSNVQAKLEALAAEQDVAVVFLPTSNVFSTGYDVFVRGGVS